jgi:YggT family protein
MGGGYFSNAGSFLLNTAFGLFIGAVMLRMLLQLVRADFYNPLSQAIVKLTNPLLRPLRRHVPAIGPIDTASLLLMVVLQVVNLLLAAAMFGVTPAIATLSLLTLAELLSKFIYIQMFGIILLAVSSWVAPAGYNPVLGLIAALTGPVLRPLRRHLPSLGGLDLSPLVALVLLQLALMLIVAPLTDLAARA